jgi:mono/diheme cytochrome c family protein
LLSAPALADSGKELFEKRCAGCHTIGGGDSTGPDLKGVEGNRSADWLEKIIVEPEKLTSEKDPVHLGLVKKYGVEMPNVGISRTDARKIVAYIKEVSLLAPGAAPVSKPADTPATPELVALGKALFTGAMPLENGGAPCSACHSFVSSGVRAGTLAVDLSRRIEAIGEQGLRAMLKSLNFPIMRIIYADKPLTEEEITALVVFSKDAVARKTAPAPKYYPATGVAIFVCLIGGFALYKRRVG